MLSSDPQAHLSHGSPPEQIWRQALGEFAARHKLPEADVLSGVPFTCNGLAFRLQYNVEFDENGLVVQMDLGPIPAETAHVVHLEMLAHNTNRPAALLGWFGVFPGAGRGAYCVRLDLRRCAQPAFAIATLIESMAGAIDESYASIKGMIRAFAGIDPDQLLSEQQAAQA